MSYLLKKFLRPFLWDQDLEEKITNLNGKKPSLAREVFREMIKSKLVVFSLVYLTFFFLVGIFGPFVCPYSYEYIDYAHVREGPSVAHWFGTDLIGRDLFTRIIYSMRSTLILSILVALFGGIFIGVALGLVSGYFAGRPTLKGGWIDTLIMRLGEILSSVPPFFMFLFLTVSFRPRYEAFFYSLGPLGEWLIKEGVVDFTSIFLIFSLFYWVGSARVIRSQTLTIKTMPYVDASRVLGAKPRWIILRHILPNVLGVVILWFFSTLGSVAMLEVGLSWLGLGIRPPHPSFGVLLSEVSSTRLLSTYPHLLIFPSIFVTLYIVAFWQLEMNLNRIIQTLYTKGGRR